MLSEEGCSRWNEGAQPRIVMGVDGSQTLRRTLAWAAREACLRGAILEVVHATLLCRDSMELEAVAPLKAREWAILDETVAKAAALAPGLVVVARAVDPPAADALVNASKGADLLVAGARGLGLFKEFALGSVSVDCARLAQWPLVIIGPRTLHGAMAADDVERRPPVGDRRP